ncbi:MAG: hypothetical protein GX620_14085 [Chloroflexi bacterium]|nr:hypothetical protein [Chloroflexota bacterium]
MLPPAFFLLNAAPVLLVVVTVTVGSVSLLIQCTMASKSRHYTVSQAGVWTAFTSDMEAYHDENGCRSGAPNRIGPVRIAAHMQSGGGAGVGEH